MLGPKLPKILTGSGSPDPMDQWPDLNSDAARCDYCRSSILLYLICSSAWVHTFADSRNELWAVRIDVRRQR